MKVTLEIEFDIDVDEKYKDKIGQIIFLNLNLPGVLLSDDFDAFMNGYKLIKKKVEE